MKKVNSQDTVSAKKSVKHTRCLQPRKTLFKGHEPPKFRGSPDISLTKYQLSVFLCLLFSEKINFLLVNQQKKSQLKLVLGRRKKK